MDTRHLEEFLVFAEDLNYSSASKKLFITRPTLTEHIAELETEFGCKFVDKENGRISLTHAGKRFVETASSLLGRINKTVDEYRNLEHDLIVIRVSSTNLPWLESILYKVRQNICARYPEKQLDIVTVGGLMTTVDALMKYDNDIAIAGFKTTPETKTIPTFPEGVRGVKLQTEEIKLLVTQKHRLFTYPSITAADLDEETIMLPADIYDGYLRDCVGQYFALQGAAINLATTQFNDHFEYFTYDFSDMIGVVPTTLLPRFGIDEREEYRTFSLSDLPLYTDFYLIYKEIFTATENGHLLIEEIKNILEGQSL